jgi:hypothetical protein
MLDHHQIATVMVGGGLDWYWSQAPPVYGLAFCYNTLPVQKEHNKNKTCDKGNTYNGWQEGEGAVISSREGHIQNPKYFSTYLPC